MSLSNLLPSRSERTLHSFLADRRVLRVLVVLGVLVLPVIVGYLGSLQHLKLAAYFILGLGGAVLLFQRRQLAIVLLPVLGMNYPVVGPSGLNLSVLLVALLLLLWFLDMVVVQKEVRLTASNANWPLLALVAVGVVSFIAGQLPLFPFAQYAPLGAQAGGLAIVLLSVGAFFLVANHIHELKWLKVLTFAFVAYGSIEVVSRAIPAVGQVTLPLRQGVFGGVFWIWIVAHSFSQAVFNRDLRPHWRILLALIVVGTIYVGLGPSFHQKSLWIPPLLVLATIIAARSWRLGALIAVIGGPIAAYASTLVLDSESYSAATRLEAFTIVADMIRGHPLFGIGFANYYWNTPLYNIRGWNVVFSTHNNYLDIVAQMGVFGLVAFLWFFLEISRIAWRLRARVSDGFSTAYVYACLGAIAGTLVTATLADWVLPFFYNIGVGGFRSSVLFWLFAAGLVSLTQIYTNETSTSESDSSHSF